MRVREGSKKLLNGLWLKRRHPELYRRSCALCRAYVFDEDGMAREDDGLPIPRPRPVNCDSCLRHRLGWYGWSPREAALFRRHEFARVRGLTEADENDPAFLSAHAMLSEEEDRLTEELRAERTAELVLTALRAARR